MALDNISLHIITGKGSSPTEILNCVEVFVIELLAESCIKRSTSSLHALNTVIVIIFLLKDVQGKSNGKKFS